MIEDKILIEGYGLKTLHLRQSTNDVISRFGRPNKKIKASDLRTYWIYSEHRFDCLISNKSKQILSLFFHEDDRALQRRNVITQKGISFASTEKEIRATYGSPIKSGDSFTTSSGDFVRRWLSYPDGIGFHFGKTGRIEIIVIFRQRRQ
jgi:hypothetical protein